MSKSSSERQRGRHNKIMEEIDWTKIMNDLMESSYHYGDLKGYMEWKKFLGFLEK